MANKPTGVAIYICIIYRYAMLYAVVYISEVTKEQQHTRITLYFLGRIFLFQHFARTLLYTIHSNMLAIVDLRKKRKRKNKQQHTNNNINKKKRKIQNTIPFCTVYSFIFYIFSVSVVHLEFILQKSEKTHLNEKEKRSFFFLLLLLCISNFYKIML